MLRADIAQPQMIDCLIAAGKEIFVVVQCLFFRPGSPLETDHIARIFGKRLPVVGLIALLDLPLKVRCGPLHGLLHLPLGHTFLRLPRLVVPHLTPIDIPPLRDRDLEGNAGFTVNAFDVSHSLVTS